MKPAPYGPFKFSLINSRPALKWPGNARVALWVITNIEFFALDRAMPGDSNERPKGNAARRLSGIGASATMATASASSALMDCCPLMAFAARSR